MAELAKRALKATAKAKKRAARAAKGAAVVLLTLFASGAAGCAMADSSARPEASSAARSAYTNEQHENRTYTIGPIHADSGSTVQVTVTDDGPRWQDSAGDQGSEAGAADATGTAAPSSATLTPSVSVTP